MSYNCIGEKYKTASIHDSNYDEFRRNLEELERVQGSVEYYLELGNVNEVNPLTETLNSLLKNAIAVLKKLFNEYEERCYLEWLDAMDEATDEAIDVSFTDEVQSW